MNRILNIAYGGFSGEYPENTNLACAKALTEGYSDGISVDVRFTKDGKAVVMTDETIDRTTTGTGYVCDYTLHELMAFDAGLKFNEKYKGEKILTLEKALGLAKNFNVKIVICLKDKQIDNNYLFSEVLEPIRLLHLENHAIVAAEDMDLLKHIKTTVPEITLSLYSNEMKWDIRNYRYVDMFSCVHTELTSENVETIHRLSRKVAAIVGDDKKALNSARESGVDIIISSYPDVCSDIVNN